MTGEGHVMTLRQFHSRIHHTLLMYQLTEEKETEESTLLLLINIALYYLLTY